MKSLVKSKMKRVIGIDTERHMHTTTTLWRLIATGKYKLLHTFHPDFRIVVELEVSIATLVDEWNHRQVKLLLCIEVCQEMYLVRVVDLAG